jgi:hypothetical protein
MLRVAQLNLQDLWCAVPRVLSDVAMITLFLGPWELPVDQRNGVNWELRAYGTMEPLIRLSEPTPARAGDPQSRKGEDDRFDPSRSGGLSASTFLAEIRSL